MIFLSELIVILAYLFNSRLGMILSIAIYAYIFLKKGNSFLEKLIYALIFSIPTFNIGFAGKEMHHMFSWCSIYIGILVIYLLFNYIVSKTKFSRKKLLAIVLILGILLVNCFREVNTRNALIEWIQIALMLIPIIFVYDQKEYLIKSISNDSEEKFVNAINYTILATSVGVIMQYILYRKMGLRLGNITFYLGRTVYDLLVSGASVLSLYLSVGVAINVKRLYDKFKIKYILYTLICLAGIVVNSSRTGLVASIIIAIIIAVPKMIKNKKNLLISLIMIPVAIVVFQNVIGTLLVNRSTSSLFDANGRIGTYQYGFQILTENAERFFLGSGLGLDNYDEILPHNFILETLVTTGAIVSITIFALLCVALKYINREKNKYIVWVILIGSMFITNFQGNTFFTIYMIVEILGTCNLINREEEMLDEKSRNIDY